MTSGDSLVDDMRAYCRAKPGVKEDLNVFGAQYPTYPILGKFLGFFAQFYLNQTPVVLLLRCMDRRLVQFQANYSSIQVSEKMKWDTVGWKWVDVLLDSSIPKTELYRLIDEAYDLIFNTLDEIEKRLIALSTQHLSEQEALQKLLELHNLNHRRAEIEGLIQPAILLKAHAIAETEIAL